MRIVLYTVFHLSVYGFKTRCLVANSGRSVGLFLLFGFQCQMKIMSIILSAVCFAGLAKCTALGNAI